MTEKIARISRSLSWRHDFIRSHDYRCHYCNRFAGSVEVGPDGKPWHVEHMDALANGGEDAEENLTLACERCNSLKSTLSYQSFRRYARAMFWTGEPTRLALTDLERLEAAYLRTSGGNWIHRDISAEREAHMELVMAMSEGETSFDMADVVAEFYAGNGHTGGSHNLRFVLEAHRLMPRLIAEIHVLHAELALARSESQATPIAA